MDRAFNLRHLAIIPRDDRECLPIRSERTPDRVRESVPELPAVVADVPDCDEPFLTCRMSVRRDCRFSVRGEAKNQAEPIRRLSELLRFRPADIPDVRTGHET